MENQKCASCGAPMSFINDKTGTYAYHCDYCGYQVNIRPESTSDKVFTFVNRAVNAFSRDDDPVEKAPQEEKKVSFGKRLSALGGMYKDYSNRPADGRKESLDDRIDHFFNRKIESFENKLDSLEDFLDGRGSRK